jgi:hypothetical protein
MSEGEIDILQQLGQIPFLPVAREIADMTPVCPECPTQEYSLSLQCLEKKQLISIDYDTPLKGCDVAAYSAYPIRGSFALTARGQQVLELLEIQGAE